MHWLRQPVWWPSLLLAVVVFAGLVVLAAQPDPDPVVITIVAAEQRQSPLPLAIDPPPTVNLNRASRAELKALPGIGETRAGAIMAARTVRPIESLADLVQRQILPASAAEALVGLAVGSP